LLRNIRRQSNQSKNNGYVFSLTLFFFLIITLFLFPFHQGHCAEVTLAWDPVDAPELAGYRIYYGNAPGNYQWVIDVGNVTSFLLNNLTIGETYYSVATAYTTNDMESSYSNEIMFTVPSCTYTISPSSASFPASGGTGSVTITTLSYCNWTTSSGIPWVMVNTGSGIGSGTMSYSVSPNTATTNQMASLTIGGNVFSVIEAGQPQYTIRVSAGAGGSITPSGQVAVQPGTGQTFTITPNSGYKITDVNVDSVSQGTVSSFTFSNVRANHTINVSFAASTW
jgi:hypothetical protein